MVLLASTLLCGDDAMRAAAVGDDEHAVAVGQRLTDEAATLAVVLGLLLYASTDRTLAR